MSTLAMEQRLKGKHVFLILLGFFGTVFAVNAVFVYMALSTRPGEESGASYETGLHYNTVIGEERAQDALQWRHATQVLPGGRLRLSITGPDSSRAAGLTVTGTIGRPASNDADHALVFVEPDAGVYEAETGGLGAGGWVLSFTAQKARPGGQPAIYRVKERLWLSEAR